MSKYYVGTTGFGNLVYYEQLGLNEFKIKVHKVKIKCFTTHTPAEHFRKRWLKRTEIDYTVSIYHNREEVSKEEFFTRVL
jgi:hypothetical protein